MINLICNATSFGYGPITKLLTIVENLDKKKYNPIYIGNGIAKKMAIESNLFKEVHDYDFNSNLTSIPKVIVDLLLNSQAMLNVLEPQSIKVAQNFNIPTIYIDSLFWMWESVPEHLKDVDCYLVQNYFGIDEKMDSLNQEYRNIKICNPIVNLKNKVECHKSNQIIFNFSGIETPFTKDIDDLLLYPKTIFEYSYKALNNSSYKNILVTGNEIVIQNLSDKYSHKFRGVFQHLSHNEFLSELNRSNLLITSPGLTATYEAMSYEVPIRYLPPQNYSQALMLDKYIKNGMADIFLDFSDLYLEYDISTGMPEDKGVQLIKEVFGKFSKDRRSLLIFEEIVNRMLTTSSPKLNKQKEILDFNNALDIEGIIHNISLVVE